MAKKEAKAGFSTLYRVVGGETAVDNHLYAHMRIVSVLSIESLGVKLFLDRINLPKPGGFSTLYRVVGGETILRQEHKSPVQVFQYSLSSRWG